MVHKSHPEALIHPDLLATGHPTVHTGNVNHTSITGDDGLALDAAIGDARCLPGTRAIPGKAPPPRRVTVRVDSQ